MPDLDPRIALMTRPIEIRQPDLGQTYLTMAQIRDYQAQAQLRDLQMQQTRLGLQQMQAIPEIYSRYQGAPGGMPPGPPAAGPAPLAPPPNGGPPFASTEASLAPSGQAGPPAYPAVGDNASLAPAPPRPTMAGGMGPPGGGVPPTAPPAAQPAPAPAPSPQTSPLAWLEHRHQMYSEMAMRAPMAWGQYGKSFMDIDTHQLQAQQNMLEQQAKQLGIVQQLFGAVRDASPGDQVGLYTQAMALLPNVAPNMPFRPPPLDPQASQLSPQAQQFVNGLYTQSFTAQQRLDQTNKAFDQALKLQEEQRKRAEVFPPQQTLQGLLPGQRKFPEPTGTPAAPGGALLDPQGNPYVTKEVADMGNTVAQQSRANLVQQNPYANNIVSALTQIHASDRPEARDQTMEQTRTDPQTGEVKKMTVNASDVALLSGFSQLVRPESTRQQSLAPLVNATPGSLEDRINRWWDQLSTGGALSPGDRQDIRQQADRLGRASMATFDTTRAQAEAALRAHPTIAAIGAQQGKEGLVQWGAPDFYAPVRSSLPPPATRPQGGTAPSAPTTGPAPARPTITLTRDMLQTRVDRYNAQHPDAPMTYDQAATRLRAAPGYKVVD